MLASQEDKDSVSPRERLNVVLEIHATLRRMTKESRPKSLRSLSDSPPARGTAAATGNH